ncbi:MAG: HAD family hydrolase [Rikenellaceae bacterium]|nr:HAD family hydrolase [Rikenellaceae bacterium]
MTLGGREGVPAKPSPDIALEILQHTDIDAADTLFIGDSGVDMQTAHAAGATSVGCAWGFRSREELAENNADHIISHPSELIALCD